MDDELDYPKDPLPVAITDSGRPHRRLVYRITPRFDSPGLEIRDSIAPRRGRGNTNAAVAPVSRVALTGLILADREGAARAEPLLAHAWARREVIRDDAAAQAKLDSLKVTVPLAEQVAYTAGWGIPILATAYTQVLLDLGKYHSAGIVLEAKEAEDDPWTIQFVHVALAQGEYSTVLSCTDSSALAESDLAAYLQVQRAIAYTRTQKNQIAIDVLERVLSTQERHSPAVRYLVLEHYARALSNLGHYDQARAALERILIEESSIREVNALYESLLNAREGMPLVTPRHDAHGPA